MEIFIFYLQKIFFIILRVYIGVALILFILQRRMLFPGSMYPALQDNSDSYPGLEHIWLETSFGKVETWLLFPIPQTDQPAPAIIFFHGNGELIDFWPDQFQIAREMGLAVMLVEFPGYGRSEGKPKISTITETVTLVFDTLSNHPGIDPDRILPYGRSLGGGAACILAQERETAGLILNSTFTSTTDMAHRVLMPGFFVLDKFDNLKCVENYQGPIFIAHGRFDEQIPYQQALTLVEHAQNAKFHLMDCGHNDCAGAEWEELWIEIQSFLLQNNLISSLP